MSNEEMHAIVENWTLVEDDPLVVDSEVDEAITLLETEAEDHILDFCDDDEPEPVDAVVEERPVLTILEAEACLEKLRRHGKARNLPSNSVHLLDTFGRRMRAQHASRPESDPTLHHFFSSSV